MKFYLKNISQSNKVNIVVLVTALVLNLCLILITNYCGTKFSFFSDKLLYWNKLINPFYILVGLSLFNLFRKKTFINKQINYISSLSLLIYIIHYNHLIQTYLEPNIFKFIYEHFPFQHSVLWIFVYFCMIFISSLLLGTLYKKIIEPIVHKICNYIYEKVTTIYKSFQSMMMKID